MKYIPLLLLISILLFGTVVMMAKSKHDRIYIKNECIKNMHWYKGDCNVEGTLVHCKEVWFEPECYSFQSPE